MLYYVLLYYYILLYFTICLYFNIVYTRLYFIHTLIDYPKKKISHCEVLGLKHDFHASKHERDRWSNQCILWCFPIPMYMGVWLKIKGYDPYMHVAGKPPKPCKDRLPADQGNPMARRVMPSSFSASLRRCAAKKARFQRQRPGVGLKKNSKLESSGWIIRKHLNVHIIDII